MIAGYADLTTHTGRERGYNAAQLLPNIATPPAAKLTPDAIIAALNEDERKELARRMLGL